MKPTFTKQILFICTLTLFAPAAFCHDGCNTPTEEPSFSKADQKWFDAKNELFDVVTKIKKAKNKKGLDLKEINQLELQLRNAYYKCRNEAGRDLHKDLNCISRLSEGERIIEKMENYFAKNNN